MSVFNFLSLNVRGLRNREKRRSIFAHLKNQKPNVYFLQETCSNSRDEKVWAAEWGGQIFYLHGQIIPRACVSLLNQTPHLMQM